MDNQTPRRLGLDTDGLVRATHCRGCGVPWPTEALTHDARGVSWHPTCFERVTGTSFIPARLALTHLEWLRRDVRFANTFAAVWSLNRRLQCAVRAVMQEYSPRSATICLPPATGDTVLRPRL